MEGLSGFDPSTMTYLATQIAHPNVGGADPFQEMLLPMELHDHQSTYGYAGYAGSCHTVQINIKPMYTDLAYDVEAKSSTYSRCSLSLLRS